MNWLGCRWTMSDKGQGNRIAGKHLVHSRLAIRSNGEPGIRIFRTCRNLIRSLPALPYSSLNPEDVDSDADDHATTPCGTR
jgi:hypothetical protein